eukprot:943601-Rhodomonas_salina.1
MANDSSSSGLLLGNDKSIFAEPSALISAHLKHGAHTPHHQNAVPSLAFEPAQKTCSAEQRLSSFTDNKVLEVSSPWSPLEDELNIRDLNVVAQMRRQRKIAPSKIQSSMDVWGSFAEVEFERSAATQARIEYNQKVGSSMMHLQ